MTHNEPRDHNRQRSPPNKPLVPCICNDYFTDNQGQVTEGAST
jgi:hypothetical protein